MKRVFKLEIVLGNAAMRSPDDLAAALVDVSHRVREGRTVGIIHDQNGNFIGAFNIIQRREVRRI